MTYRMVDLIQKKRDSGEFSQAEIAWMIENYVKGIVPDSQLTALARAIYFSSACSVIWGSCCENVWSWAWTYGRNFGQIGVNSWLQI